MESDKNTLQLNLTDCTIFTKYQRENNIKIYLCLVYYSKVFDKIKWERLSCWKMSTPHYLVNLVGELFENNNARVRVTNMYSSRDRGAYVRKSCLTST